MRHRISDPDPETRTGSCSVCEPVGIYKGATYKNEGTWRCGPAARKQVRSRYEEVKDRQRDLRFQRKYGITADEYDRMLADQDGVCARCKEPPGMLRLAVDHCHNTGRVRGLLCGPCNTYIGRLEANMDRLDEDLAYISYDVLRARL